MPQVEKDTIIQVLRESQTVAIVGLSGNPERPSYDVARFLKKRGCHIIAVNPNLTEVLGTKSYPDLLSISEPVDVVDIFRRSAAVSPIIDQAIRIGAKAVWMQKGVKDEKAAATARAAGLLVVMDHCMMEEIKKLTREGLLPESPHSVAPASPP